MIERRWTGLLAAALVVLAVAGAGCARRSAVLELQAVVLYDKPVIRAIEHSIDDRRGGGGAVEVRVVLEGDPGLAASFDISPGVARQVALEERTPGRYVGSFVFPFDALGGPYTVLGRLSHARAGEVVAQDPTPIFIELPELGR